MQFWPEMKTRSSFYFYFHRSIENCFLMRKKDLQFVDSALRQKVIGRPKETGRRFRFLLMLKIPLVVAFWVTFVWSLESIA